MVHNCAIISCSLHNRRNIRKGLLFHSFPVDQHRFELWRQTVFNHCSQTLSINKHSKICYRHFQSDDYIANHTGLTRYLKATAIPSIFVETNRSIKSNNNNNSTLSETTTNSSLLILPSTSSTTTTTNTKAKRLLNTIDKLHQIQNANQKINLVSNINIENEQIKIDENENKITDEQQSICSLFPIDRLNTSKESQIFENNFSQQSDLVCWSDNSMITLPKNHLEDALFKFLEQANLIQYYSAFIEQGGDDLKQLAEAQNDDFQEIITLVGMASKPLHVKRFKKALLEYQQSSSSAAAATTEEILSDRNLFSPYWCFNKNENNKINNAHQLLDDNQRKMIADEAERLTSLIPITPIKKFQGQNQISKDLFVTMNLPRDFEDRWQRIRKYSAIYNRFDSKTPHEVLNLHEILINEAAAAISFHRPEFLTRRDELLHLARRVLQNIGILTGSTTNNVQKRMITCDVRPNKQMKLAVSLQKPQARQRDSDAFRLMWHNREAKVEQIPLEIEALRCEQNKLLQQLKQNTIDPISSSINITELKKQIDDLSTKIEQLTDEEKNLRRLIRKKNMRLRAKERQQQKQQISSHQSSMMSDIMLPIIPIIPSSVSLPIDTCQYQQETSDIQISDDSIEIKNEKIESTLNLSSPILKPRKENSSTLQISKNTKKRREEVNNKLNNLKTKILLPTTTRIKQSLSTTTVIERFRDYDSNSQQNSSDSLTLNHTNDDILVESKSFLDNITFNCTNLIETNE